MTETTTPDDVSLFRDRLVQSGFTVDLDEFPNEWFIEVTRNGRSLEVAWRPDRGFGFFTSGHDVYGVKPDEIVSDAEEAVGRFRELFDLSGVLKYELG